MAKPAARVGDNHICPMTDGPKPHFGGPILPPGKPTVLIGGLPASTLGNSCLCVSPAPDSIVQGSPTVLISGLPAARLFDKTLHGGSIVFGAGTVLIGEFAAVAAMKVFPGKQHYNNCGVQSSEQIIHQATGKHLDEDSMLGVAVAGQFASDVKLAKNGKIVPAGGTTDNDRQGLLAEFGVSSTIIKNPTKQNISDALKEDKGVIANVDAGVLWNNSRYIGGGHAVVITEGDFDENGTLTHVYINDTGTGQQARRLSTDDMLNAMQSRVNRRGDSSYQINVTDMPIWTKIH